MQIVSRAVGAMAVLGSLALPLVESPAGAAGSLPAVTVAGNQLLRDGVPWVPRGFTMIGVLSPTNKGAAGTAHAHLGDAEMRAAKAWGIDSLRFQVSQRGLDPTDSLHSAAYVDRIRDAVDLAARHGFVSILSVQDQSLGGGTAHPMPSAATRRALGTLTANFNHRPDVLYTLYNEPQNLDDPASWALWRDGGSGEGNQGDPVVGHQALLGFVRSTGSTNVVIAEGGRYGGSLLGVPILDDPAGQLAYGVHPYLSGSRRFPAGWHSHFGYLTATHPVIATEWNAHSFASFCQDEWPDTSAELLRYLRDHRIGLYAWAFDFIDSLVSDWNWTPTSFDGYRCGRSGGGAGELVRAHFVDDDPSVEPGIAKLTFAPLADATVRSKEPKKNRGTEKKLRVDGGPKGKEETYLRFDVKGVTAPPERVLLRLYANSGSADAPALYETSGGWHESGKQGITWKKRPAGRTPVADAGPAPAGQWVEYDVTDVVRSNGAVNFVLATGAHDGIEFASKQARSAERPQLVVTPA